MLNDSPLFQKLDTFYFHEIAAKLHISLQNLALDRRVLRHEAVEQAITTTRGLYQPHYSHLPLLLSEIFNVSESDLLTFSKAWFLSVVDVVVTDHFVDRQLPDLPTIALFLHQIRLDALEIYQQQFPSSGVFWTKFYENFRLLWDALAHEVYCVEQHQQLYTYEQMQRVYTGKAAFMHLAIYGMGELSQQPEYVEPLKLIYNNVTLADQLIDDVQDWEADWEAQRLTLPVVMVMEAAQISLQELKEISTDKLDSLMAKYNIEHQVAERAVTLLEQAINEINKIEGAGATVIARMLQSRLEIAQNSSSRYKKLRLFRAFTDNLTQGLS